MKPPSQPLIAALPYVMMAMVALVDLLSGPEVGFLPLVALGPAFASLIGGLRRTAMIGLVALVLCVLLSSYNNVLGTRRSYTSLASVLGVTAAGMVAAAGRQRRERELADVRSIAEVAQRVLLRPVPRRAGPLRVAVSYTSAVAEARIGGDLYEVVTAPRGSRVIVGDVQGKGLEAVETAAVVLGAFREAAHDEPDLAGVSGRLEKALNRHLSGEEFVTAVLAEVTSDRRVTLLNYGHPSPLLIRADGSTAFIDPAEAVPPLGLASLGPSGPVTHEVTMGDGDQILFYTDGVSEARDERGRFYPLAERVGLLKEEDPDVALEALRRDLVAHANGPLHDDAAMLLIRYRSAE